VLFNELAQWSALVCIGILTLGLTRQLGAFLIPPTDHKALEVGPDVGKRFPQEFLSHEERSQLLASLEDRGAEQAFLLVVSERCPTCHSLLDDIVSRPASVPLPIVALSRESTPDHLALLEEVADLVVVDAARLDRVNLTVGPLALLVDRQLTVLDKQLVFDAAQLEVMATDLSAVATSADTVPTLAVVSTEARAS